MDGRGKSGDGFPVECTCTCICTVSRDGTRNGEVAKLIEGIPTNIRENHPKKENVSVFSVVCLPFDNDAI